MESLFSSDIFNYNCDIYVINNHSNFSIDDGFKDKTKVLNNNLRADFSTGHLSRNWNQAIINGFKSLVEPDCEIVIACQEDTIFLKDTFKRTFDLHKKYTFIQAGRGDNYMSFTPTAVKNIGLWDERFCNIGYQEADYFIRAYLYNRNSSTINDFSHKRFWNKEYDCYDAPILHPWFKTGQKVVDVSQAHKDSQKHHDISRAIFQAKWGKINDLEWNEEFFKALPPKPLIPNYIFYPYFEKNIIDLKGKGYVSQF